jgi:hypothetical protein
MGKQFKPKELLTIRKGPCKNIQKEELLILIHQKKKKSERMLSFSTQ